MLKGLQILFIQLFGRTIYYWLHIFGICNTNARSIVLSSDGYIVMLKTNFSTSELIIPGGAVNEFGEDPIDASLRECGEEIILTNKSTKTIIVLEKQNTSQLGCYLRGEKKIQHRHIFVTKVPEKSTNIELSVKDGIEIESVAWYALNSLDTSKLSTEMQQCLIVELPLHLTDSNRMFIRKSVEGK